MSASILNAISTDAVTEPTPSSIETCQAIVFKVAGNLLALPLPAVLRVLTNSTEFNNNHSDRLVYVEQQPIPIINLRPFLQVADSSVNAIALTTPQPFLLLAALCSTSPIAIPVDEAPNLMTLSPATMQALPQTYRQRIGNIASHVAVIPQQKQQQSFTILLLDLHQLLSGSKI